MKNLIIFFAIGLLFSYCNKKASIIDPIVTPPTPIDTTVTEIDTIKSVIEFGKSSMKKNGVKWNVPIQAKFYNSAKNRFYLLATVKEPNSIDGTMAILDIGSKKGKFAIETNNAANLNNLLPEAIVGYYYEEDQSIGRFFTDSTRFDHNFEILKYDSITHVVEGTFQMFLGKSPTSVPFPGIPDSIFITEGKFNLKIEE
jgi:hypothetical protein